MNKNIFKLAIFIFILLSNTKIVQSADYADCSPNYINSDNEISLSSVPAPSSGVCLTEANSYRITIYEVHFCTSLPAIPTTSSAIDITDCEIVFQNSSGSTINLSTNTSESLSGSMFKPPASNYTHAYVKLDNILGIKGKVNFSDQQYTGQQNEGSGYTCVTRSTTKEILTGTTFPQNTSSCGESSLAAETKLIELRSLDCCSGLVATDSTSDININNSGQDGIPSLVDSNGYLITDENSASTIDYVIDFNSNLVIGENLIDITLKFNVSSSLEVNNYSNSFILFMPGAPQIIIETTHSTS